MLPSVDLLCPEQVNYPQGCAGFGEPTLDVAGDGTIWYSAVCCVGQSPPIWLSDDGGVSWRTLPFAERTGLIRDATGIEGDFAIDDAGNVYFFDIMAATAFFTKYDADGTHIHSKTDPFPPLVDRPWVRAGAEDEVFILYNTGTDTRFYRSTDGGLTWDHLNARGFGCGLGGFGQGAERHDLFVHACGSVFRSTDGGLTWDDGTALDLPADRTINGGPRSPVYADDDNTAYVPYVYEAGHGGAVGVTAVDVDGNQIVHELISPASGIADYPWVSAGKPGQVAVAYYGADNVTRANATDAEWYLRIAFTENANEANATWTVIDGDPEVLFTGNLGRQPGDFLQIRTAENGDLVVAYAAREPNGGSLVNRFVRSTGLDMGHEIFRNGPLPA